MSSDVGSANRSAARTWLATAIAAPRARRALALVLVSPLLLAVLTAQAPTPAQRPPGDMTFFAVLNGGQETGGSVSNAFGVGFFTFDRGTRMLCYAINYGDLSSGETGAHFHGPARPGEDAGVLLDISAPVGSPKEGCVGPLTPKQRNMLRRGRMYVNVHSTTAPAGEIRGQVVLLNTVK